MSAQSPRSNRSGVKPPYWEGWPNSPRQKILGSP